ncbi:chromate efflux transporter [Bacillus sp. DJP31]|uniref:chromate efflux transporter n=1 Tax=Bacillus sp. DJP31 TaxID=3409789 RepID=UPI003BB5AC0A
MRDRIVTYIEILKVSTLLGLTSFGGPIAHLGYFRNEYVEKRKWLNEGAYAQLVAICQFLPGPASSQVGFGIGVIRGGIVGGFISWIGFTLPSILVLLLFGVYFSHIPESLSKGIFALKLVAVAVVLQAIMGMWKNITDNRSKKTIAILTAVLISIWPFVASQVIVVISSAVVGMYLFRKQNEGVSKLHFPISKTVAFISLALFFLLLGILPILTTIFEQGWLTIADIYYRSGSLVFGGGHVVLPLLEREVVPSGFVTKDEFLSGYGLAQAVPGPLFTFASFLGAVQGGIFGSVVATIAIFLPAFLLVIGTIPFWNVISSSQKLQGAVTGVNSAVVGILIAAFYDPVFTSAVNEPLSFAIALLFFFLLTYWKVAPLLIVVVTFILGLILY